LVVQVFSGVAARNATVRLLPGRGHEIHRWSRGEEGSVADWDRKGARVMSAELLNNDSDEEAAMENPTAEAGGHKERSLETIILNQTSMMYALDALVERIDAQHREITDIRNALLRLGVTRGAEPVAASQSSGQWPAEQQFHLKNGILTSEHFLKLLVGPSVGVSVVFAGIPVRIQEAEAIVNLGYQVVIYDGAQSGAESIQDGGIPVIAERAALLNLLREREVPERGLVIVGSAAEAVEATAKQLSEFPIRALALRRRSESVWRPENFHSGFAMADGGGANSLRTIFWFKGEKIPPAVETWCRKWHASRFEAL
jgi:hypothetical protein